MASRKFLLFGLQRSGTNFIESIMSHNFDVDFHEYNYWKHAYDNDIEDEFLANIPVIVVYKNPHKWIESVTRTPKGICNHYDLGKDNNTEPDDILIGFNDDKEIIELRNKGIHMISHTTGEKIKPAIDINPTNQFEYDLKKLVGLWNNFYNYWVNRSTPQFYFIRFRNIIMHPDKYMNTLSRFYDMDMIRQRGDNWHIPPSVSQSDYTFTDQHKADYVNFKLNVLTPEQAKRINQYVDIHLIQRLGLELF